MTSNEQSKDAYWRHVHASTPQDLAAVCFPEHPVWFNRFYDRIQQRAVADALRPYGAQLQDGRALDLGCGRGRWLTFLTHKLAMTAQGVDIAPSAIEACREQGLDAVLGSVADLPFPDSSVDLVMSITVLMHVTDDVKQDAVRELSRVLREGGLALLIEGTWRDPAPHVFNLDLAGWKQLARANGLSYERGFGHCFTPAHRYLPLHTPGRNYLATAIDYPAERVLMAFHRDRPSERAMQHLMLFSK